MLTYSVYTEQPQNCKGYLQVILNSYYYSLHFLELNDNFLNCSCKWKICIYTISRGNVYIKNVHNSLDFIKYMSFSIK